MGTWMDVVRELRLADGQRVTDGERSWDVERDGFGRYTLRGVERDTPTIWDSRLAATTAPGQLRFAAAPSRRRRK